MRIGIVAMMARKLTSTISEGQNTAKDIEKGVCRILGYYGGVALGLESVVLRTP